MKDSLRDINRIRFSNADDFFIKKAFIREIYRKLDFETKELYKWYFFYQLCLLKNPLKELFWDYLNQETLDIEFLSVLSSQYIIFCSRRDKMAKEQSN